ncbi:Uma2 family endonuclease [Pseudonocardia sp. TRM90224]|uniref:Uma2 family endonuclease n=1 Tax=Pseudonocardia sp. TRM90224 TaxID=2812678 RepID=UPI001E2A2A0B|nr:Uma2 family endonuclease [Pseudonocardia sp. TRM90224]
MDHPVFSHIGPWTEDDFLGLGEKDVPADGRVELIEGALLIGPATAEHRGGVVRKVRDVLERALPSGLRVLGPVPLRVGTDCVLVPDLVVTRAAAEGDGTEAADDTTSAVIDAADTLMVVEIIGREHGAADRTFKPQLYARSRIPYSVLIDHDGPFGVANMIIGGRYHEYARAAAGETLLLEEPFRLEVDLDAVSVRAEPEDDPGEPVYEPDPAATTGPDIGSETAAVPIVLPDDLKFDDLR